MQRATVEKALAGYPKNFWFFARDNDQEHRRVTLTLILNNFLFLESTFPRDYIITRGKTQLYQACHGRSGAS
jgi:hypothetical protein